MDKGSTWHPETTFWKLKKYQPTKIYGGNEKFTFYYDNEYHSVWYGERFQLTFSCPFDLQKFPFDSNECRMEYGDYLGGVNYTAATIVYDDRTTRDGAASILIDDLPYPFEFEIQSIPTFNRTIADWTYSSTGMLLIIKRKSFRKLISGFYYPTAAFALLSMISFLIKPDVVSNEVKVSFSNNSTKEQ